MENLKGKNSWNNILGEKAKAVNPLYEVIVFNEKTNKINPKEVEKSIDMIQDRNKEVKSLCVMKISWLEWFKPPKL